MSTESAREAKAPAEVERIVEEVLMILHDLKSPLGVILANATFLRERGSTAAERREAVEDIGAAVADALRIAENILVIARLDCGRQPPNRAPADLAQLVLPLFQRRRRPACTRSVAMTTELAPSLPVPIDSGLLARVVDNLLDNALRYTPEGGRIHLRIAPASRGVRLELGNTGHPIPASKRELIFQRYEQLDGARPTNLGLGLFFCRRVIEAHGGSIRIEESPELATVFAIELPGALE
jgi:signal transduction histidine kinase